MNILDEYILNFNNYPPLIETFSYEDEIYQKLIKNAIDRNKKLTFEEINDYIEKNKIRYDVVV